jgi:hypothetical protein
MKNRLLRVSMVAVLALGVGAVVEAAPGGAAGPAQKCTHLTGSATLTPGISKTARAQTAKATGKLTGCTPAAGKTGGSGTITATLKIAKGSCATLAGGGQKFNGTAKSVWKNKKTSNYTLTFTTGKGSAAKVTTATITGKVSAGLFKGHKVTGAIKFTPKKGQNCLTVPVKNLTFVQAKAFQIA